MATKTKRLEIRAEEGFINELNRLAEASGTTRAEVIDRAIGLYATALHEVEQGKTLKFVFPDSKRETAVPSTAGSMGVPGHLRDVIDSEFTESEWQGPSAHAAETIR
jgi:hypothetical protein